MIDQDVLSRALQAALRTGAEFAEVYAEDKRSSSAYLDDGIPISTAKPVFFLSATC